MKNIAVYGGGGFGREVVCLIQMINEIEPIWNFIGYFDDGYSAGIDSQYGKMLGDINALNAYPTELAVVLAIGVPETLKTIVEKIINPKISFPNIIAPNVIMLDKESVIMGKGNVICSNCLLSCNINLGDFNILNSCIPVGHETEIGNYNVIMPSSNISGGVKIGDCNFLGVKSTILQYIKIGNRVRVGANSVIIRNTQDNNLYMGNPALKVKFN